MKLFKKNKNEAEIRYMINNDGNVEEVIYDEKNKYYCHGYNWKTIDGGRLKESQTYSLFGLVDYLFYKIKSYEEIEKYYYEQKNKDRIKELENKFNCKIYFNQKTNEGIYYNSYYFENILKIDNKEMELFISYNVKDTFNKLYDENLEDKIKIWIHDNVCSTKKRK